jgi:hypothetical protein
MLQLKIPQKRKYTKTPTLKEEIHHHGNDVYRKSIGPSNPGAQAIYSEASTRWSAALETGQRPDSLQIATMREGSRVKMHEQRNGFWFYNDAFTEKLIRSLYPNLETNPKQYAKATELLTVLMRFYRMGKSAADIAATHKRKTRTIQSKINRAAREARRMIKKRSDLQPDKQTSRQLRKRILVKAGSVAIADYDAIVSLCGHADAKIREQARLALVEFQQKHEALDALVAELKSLQRKAA